MEGAQKAVTVFVLATHNKGKFSRPFNAKGKTRSKPKSKSKSKDDWNKSQARQGTQEMQPGNAKDKATIKSSKNGSYQVTAAKRTMLPTDQKTTGRLL